MAGLTGLEPATSCVTGRRSNQAELQPLAEGRKSGRNIYRFVTTTQRPFPSREAKRGRILMGRSYLVKQLKIRVVAH